MGNVLSCSASGGRYGKSAWDGRRGPDGGGGACDPHMLCRPGRRAVPRRLPGAVTVRDRTGTHLHGLAAPCARERSQEGSTLIGVVLGIIVLAVLACIVVLAVGTTTKNAPVAGTTKNASVVACNQTVKTLETALEAYKAQSSTGSYPTTLAVLTTKTTETPTNPRGPWLKQVPSAQLTKNGYVISYTDTATGKLTVKTKTTTLPGTTATACKAA